MSGQKDIGTYLSRATRGLSRQQRQDITSELLGHIEARVQDFKLAGMTDAEALRQTLRELGTPEHVHSGMQRVYLWPRAMRTGGLLGALACTAVLLFTQLSSVLAQVQGYHPSFTPLPGPYTYVDTLSLRDELQKAGVQVSGALTRPTLQLPGLVAPVQVNTLQDDFPAFVNRTLVRDYATGRDFIDLNTVVGAAIQAGVSARVEGWLNPKLHLGAVTLNLGTPDQPLEAYNLYHLALNPLARQLGLSTARSTRQDDVSIFSRHTLKIGEPGDLYALVSVQRMSSVWGRGKAPVLYFDAVPVDARGELRFRMPYGMSALQLTSDPAQLQADAGWLAQGRNFLNYATPDHPAHALLLKLNGQLNGKTFDVVPLNFLSTGESD